MQKGSLILLGIIGILLVMSESQYFPWPNLIGMALIWIGYHYWPKDKFVNIERFNSDYLKRRR